MASAGSPLLASAISFPAFSASPAYSVPLLHILRLRVPRQLLNSLSAAELPPALLAFFCSLSRSAKVPPRGTKPSRVAHGHGAHSGAIPAMPATRKRSACNLLEVAGSCCLPVARLLAP